MNAWSLLKIMKFSVFAGIIIAITWLAPSCLCQNIHGTKYDDKLGEVALDSAKIVHGAGPRVYIDKGTKNGIDCSWSVSIWINDLEMTNIPLKWCGDDLSYFVNPDTALIKFEIGQMLTLIQRQNDHHKRYKITIAFPAFPALPHEGAKNYHDREFRGLITTSLDDVTDFMQYDEVQRESPDPPRYNPVTILPRENIYFSDGSKIGKCDILYSLLYFLNNLTPETYVLHYLKNGTKNLIISITNSGHLILDYPLGRNHLEKALAACQIPIFKAPQEISLDSLSANVENLLFHFDTIAIAEPSYGISSGPYYLAGRSSEEVLLVRNIYHQKAREYPDTILIKIMPDYLRQKLAFQLGQLDLLEINYSDIDNFGGDYRLAETLLQEIAVLSSNTQKTYLSDGILNTALIYLINKESLCRVALGGMARPWSLDSTARINRFRPAYQYNPAKGKSLLKNSSELPKYLSIYLNPDDFSSRRSAEYIKGLLEQEGLYLTIYSSYDPEMPEMDDYVRQFDIILSRIDISNDNHIYLLNQMAYMPHLNDPLSNKSLFYSGNHGRAIKSFLKSSDPETQELKRYYQILNELPWGMVLFQPKRKVVLGRRIRELGFTPQGYIDFSRIELGDESEK